MTEQQAKITLRQQSYKLLEINVIGLGRLINIALMSLIFLTVIVVIIESVPAIYTPYASLFLWFEYITIAIFSIEYLIRIWAAAEIEPSRPWHSRWQYIKSPMAIIDLLAIAPFYFGLFWELDTRFLRAIRLLRVLKLTRYSTSLSTLTNVLKNETPNIISALSIMLVLIILTSAGIYLVEREAQPDVFGTIPQAIWWSTITLTTVGYGDVVPITFAGKAFGIVITILGLGVAALPAGIIANGLSSEVQRRREEFQAEVVKDLVHGDLTREELKELAHLRTELGLSAKETKNLLRIIRSESNPKPSLCPHCGKDILHH